MNLTNPSRVLGWVVPGVEAHQSHFGKATKITLKKPLKRDLCYAMIKFFYRKRLRRPLDVVLFRQ
jgi:hypothetical protein